MRSHLVLSIVVLASTGCLKKPGADRRPVPMTGVMAPTDKPTVDAYIARAKKLGCQPEKAPGSGLPSLMCYGNKGEPRFIFHEDNTVWCGISPGREKFCDELWTKIANP